MTTTVRFIPGTTREANTAAAELLAAVGAEAQIGWVDIGATYGAPDDFASGEALFAEMFGA